jgi:spore coat polysaccharide biosynthesis protein SpsF
MSKRVIAVVEARMGSSRLPGKSMRPIAGVPLVERVLDRVRRARTLDGVVLATSVLPGDDVLANHVGKLGIPVYRGSEADVLSRILGAAESQEATIHVQCWGDCPLLEPAEVDRVTTALLESDLDLVGNNYGDGRELPYGLDVIALRVSALRKAEAETRESAYHREHGTTYLYQNPDKFRVHRLEPPADLCFPTFDATINTADDYAFISRVYEALLPRKAAFDIRDVFALVRETPEFASHPNARALTSAST